MDDALKFENRRMNGATFHNVGMAEAVFDDVNLKGARFQNVNLSGAVLDDVNFSNVRLENVNIEGLTIYGYDIHELLQPLLERDDKRK